MPEMTKYQPGTPSWVDLGSADLEASKRFYGGLFGWTADTAPQPEAGGYTMFSLNGKHVAGLGPLMSEGQPPAWTTYVSVEDADSTVKAAQEAGATVFMEPMDVMDVGRMAIFADPAGAVMAVWQPRAHPGAGLVNEPGAFAWNELGTRDTEGAKTFYRQVFGWGEHTSEGPMPYTEWKLDDRSIGGMRALGDETPAEVPPHWLVYFGVADCDASVAKAGELGASVVVPPMDIPDVGRFAVLSDPQGAMFAVFQM